MCLKQFYCNKIQLQLLQPSHCEGHHQKLINLVFWLKWENLANSLHKFIDVEFDIRTHPEAEKTKVKSKF